MKKITYFFFIIVFVFLIACKKDKNDDNNVLTPQKDTSIYPGYEEFYTDESDLDVDTLAIENENVVPDSNDQILVEDQTGNLKPATENQVSKSKSFYIIVGSYKNVNNAQNKLKYFKKIGYSAEMLPKYGEYNRISAVNFNDETSARTELSNLRKKFNDKTFWLLIR